MCCYYRVSRLVQRKKKVRLGLAGLGKVFVRLNVERFMNNSFKTEILANNYMTLFQILYQRLDSNLAKSGLLKKPSIGYRCTKCVCVCVFVCVHHV